MPFGSFETHLETFYQPFNFKRNISLKPWRLNELQKNLENISQKVLTDNLRVMEADEIITRTVYAEVPPHVEYDCPPLSKR